MTKQEKEQALRAMYGNYVTYTGRDEKLKRDYFLVHFVVTEVTDSGYVRMYSSLSHNVIKSFKL